MAEIVKTLLTQILLRNDVEANWSSVNPVLGKGEIAISSDKNQFKIGDGSSQWSALSYFEGALNTRVADLETHKTSYEAKVNALETEVGMGAENGKTRIDTLEETVSGIVSVGGQANVLEVVKVKDENIVTFDEQTKTATIDLSAYAKTANVNNTLAGYVTSDALAEAIKDFVTDGELATALAKYVTLEAYNTKVQALEKADQDLDAAVKAIYKKEGEVESGVLVEKLTAAANDVDAKLEDYYTAEEIDGKVETINGAIDGKVAKADYDVKVKALEDEDARIAGLVATEQGRAEGVEAGLQKSINDVDAKFASYETATVAQGKYETQTHASETYLTKADAQSTYETIAKVDLIRNTLNGTGEGEAHVPGLVEKVAANTSAIETHENEIKALQQAQAGGLVREIITKEELAELVANPSEAADNVIYMVPNQGAGASEANDVYDEYIKVRTSAAGVEPAVYAIEFLGDTEVDLSQYYTKQEIADLGYATATYVNEELGKKVDTTSYTTDQNNLKGRVDKVEAKLSDIAENEKVKAVIDAAVKVEADRAKGIEEDFEERIADLEELGLAAGSTYATKAELQKEAEDRANEDTALGNRIKAIEDLGLAANYALKSEVEAVAGDLDKVEAKLVGVEETVVKTAEAAAASAVAGEATLREQADQTLQNNIDTEKGRIDTLIGKTAESEGDAGKSVRTIAAEVHAANEVVKSAGEGLVIENNVIKFAEGIFVLDGGNASNRPTQVEKAE